MRAKRAEGGICSVVLNCGFLAVLGMTLTGATPAGGQSGARRSGIAGTVSDTGGRPIRLANLFVDGASVATTTDDSGHFYLRGLPSGKNGFTVTKIGYAPVSFEASLLPDSMIVLSIHMRSVQTLDPVKVSAERMNTYLARTGFIERKKMAMGTFLTPEHIDSIEGGVGLASELLRGVRGIELRGCRAACKIVAHSALTSCLWLFVDGVPHGFADQLDSLGISPFGVAAIEVYDRPSIVPMEFQGALPIKSGRGFSNTGGCGAIAVWTKSKVP